MLPGIVGPVNRHHQWLRVFAIVCWWNAGWAHSKTWDEQISGESALTSKAFTWTHPAKLGMKAGPVAFRSLAMSFVNGYWMLCRRKWDIIEQIKRHVFKPVRAFLLMVWLLLLLIFLAWAGSITASFGFTFIHDPIHDHSLVFSHEWIHENFPKQLWH